MKRTLDQMYNSYDSHRPLKRHKTNNDLYEIMVSLERRINKIENKCKIILDESIVPILTIKMNRHGQKVIHRRKDTKEIQFLKIFLS